MGAQTVAFDLEKIECGAEIIARGGTWKAGLLAAGYSESYAEQGRVAVPEVMWKAIARHQAKIGKQYGLLAREFNHDEVAGLVEGRLIANTIAGNDDGIGSAKLLGSMRKHKLFETESMAQAVILAVPVVNPAGKPIEVADEHDLLGE